nr:hypothetical protein [Thiorhodococcus mannitoliphagus]
MAEEAKAHGIVDGISAHSIERFLREVDLKPYRVQSWGNTPRDGDFAIGDVSHRTRPTAKARLKCLRVQSRDHFGNAIVGRHAVGKRLKLTQPTELRFTELLHRLLAFCSAEYPRDRYEQDFHQRILLVTLNARILELRKMFGKYFY